MIVAHCLHRHLAIDFLRICVRGHWKVFQIPMFLYKFVSPGAVSLVLLRPCGRPTQSTVSCDYTGAYLKTDKQVSAGLALCNRMKA